MKIKTMIAAVAAVFATNMAMAAPGVSGVTMTQDDATRLVTINYTLEDEPAIVTIDICTNGVSIGGKNLRYFSGDANKKLGLGAHSATWQPRKAWPGHVIDSGVTAVVTAWATNCPPDYMVTSLVAANSTRFYASEESLPYDVTNNLFKTEYLVMRKIPAGGVLWRMGSPTSETGRQSNGRETPHLVTLANDFYIGVFEMTQKQYELIKGDNPSNGNENRETRPVERVSWEMLRGTTDTYNWPANGHAVDSSTFIGKLRKHTGVNSFDIPLETQWEFACRAGCGNAIYTGKEIASDASVADANMDEVAWTKGNATQTQQVGKLVPNAYGLYDMLGNVWEWCIDAFQTDITACDPNVGPTGLAADASRVSRGGGVGNWPKDCRVARRSSDTRTYTNSFYGFRIACAAEVQ